MSKMWPINQSKKVNSIPGVTSDEHSAACWGKGNKDFSSQKGSWGRGNEDSTTSWVMGNKDFGEAWGWGNEDFEASWVGGNKDFSSKKREDGSSLVYSTCSNLLSVVSKAVSASKCVSCRLFPFSSIPEVSFNFLVIIGNDTVPN